MTGNPYRAHHAYYDDADGRQLPLWFDLDRAKCDRVVKYVYQRRQHIVQEAVQLTLDLDHWNSVHPTQQPVSMKTA